VMVAIDGARIRRGLSAQATVGNDRGSSGGA